MTPTPAIPLPKLVTQAVLDKLAAADETHEVHIIVRRIVNQAPYTLRGRLRQYIVPRDHKRGCHVLRVPLSVWMAGCPAHAVVQNDSICYDITSTRTMTKSPLTFEMWRTGAEPEKVEDAKITQPEFTIEAHEGFLAILTLLNAPDPVAKAFHLAITGNVVALGNLHDEIKADLERQPMSAAERQRKRRERIKAEKAEKEQLQHV